MTDIWEGDGIAVARTRAAVAGIRATTRRPLELRVRLNNIITGEHGVAPGYASDEAWQAPGIQHPYSRERAPAHHGA